MLKKLLDILLYNLNYNLILKRNRELLINNILLIEIRVNNIIFLFNINKHYNE